MRGFVVTLALLFLTGTQVTWQHDEPQTREVIENYLNKERDLGREAVTQIESSDLGKQLDFKSTKKFDTLSANALALKKQLNPYVDKVKEQVSVEREKDIPLREKIHPVLEDFQRKWAEDVKSFIKTVRPMLKKLQKQFRDVLQAFYKQLHPVVKDFGEELHSEVDSMRANLSPNTDELRQKKSKPK